MWPVLEIYVLVTPPKLLNKKLSVLRLFSNCAIRIKFCKRCCQKKVVLFGRKFLRIAKEVVSIDFDDIYIFDLKEYEQFGVRVCKQEEDYK